jgi:hypothetical protein
LHDGDYILNNASVSLDVPSCNSVFFAAEDGGDDGVVFILHQAALDGFSGGDRWFGQKQTRSKYRGWCNDSCSERRAAL